MKSYVPSALSAALVFSCGTALGGPPPGGYLDESKYPNIVRPEYQFGTYGSAAGLFMDPCGVAIDPEHRIYVADSGNHRIQVLEKDGRPVRTWGVRGTLPGQFNSPRAVALAPDGEVFVLDQGNDRVQVFAAGGDFIRAFGNTGRKEGQLLGANDLCVDTGHVYLADSGNHRIQVFDRTGRFELAFGRFGAAEGQFRDPRGVAVDETGAIYVADSLNHRIQKFDARGRFQTAWGTYGSHNGMLATPVDVAFRAGELYVVDLVNHRLQVFDSEGHYLYQWGRHPPLAHEGNGRVHYPAAIALAPGGNLAVICEPFENRCQVFDRKALAKVENVNDSAWWDKATRFHYGTKTDSSTISMAIAEPDTHTVVLFDHRQVIPTVVTRIADFGSGLGNLIEPTGVAIDEQRDILYISDKGNNRVSVHRLGLQSGRPGEFVRAFGKAGTELGQFNEPSGIDTDAVGNIYVADIFNFRIQVFDPELNPRFAFGKPGGAPDEFIRPNGLYVDQERGRILVADLYNAAVKVFNLQGQFQKLIGKHGHGDGEFITPFAITQDAAGAIYVSDPMGQRISKFDAEGTFLRSWGHFGTDKGQFYKPKGITWSPRHQLLYAIDFGNHRGQIFTADGEFRDMFGLAESGATLRLVYDGALQSAGRPEGPYAAVPGASSPYMTRAVGNAAYFRASKGTDGATPAESPEAEPGRGADRPQPAPNP